MFQKNSMLLKSNNHASASADTSKHAYYNGKTTATNANVSA